MEKHVEDLEEMKDTVYHEIILKDNHQATALLGQFNRNLNYVRDHFDVQIIARGDQVKLIGEEREVERVRILFDKLLELIDDNHVPDLEEVRYLVGRVKENQDVKEVLSDVIQVTHWGEEIRPKTVGQGRYVEAVVANDVTFAIGPAGTGKTYLAVALAIKSLQQGKVKRIVLTRPAVVAGEELGFLPGDIQAKVSPYLRPLYDAIYDMIPWEEFKQLREDGRIEIAPLAYMRGRTFNDSFVILDEAQNVTPNQMKMFLTRLGFNSKVVVTGDITQIDLKQASGLDQVRHVLNGIEGIAFIYLQEQDVVRHQLVKQIIGAYQTYDAKKKK
ncbi:MAG: PhoH family protein [Candidatus Bipolaricaulia bacterium]